MESDFCRGKSFTDLEDTEKNILDQSSLPELSVEIPLGSKLALELQTNSSFILMYEMMCQPKPTEGPRFLATMGVFTCIAVFARAESGRAFAAHVPLGSCHFASREHGHPMLEEMVVALKWVFRKEKNAATNVKVTLVGGQGVQDHDRALNHKFSEIVKDAVLRAGISQIDERLLNVFPGVQFNPRFEQEQAEIHQSFQLAALDRKSGHVVVHTHSSMPGFYNVPALENRGKIETMRYVSHFSRTPMGGQRCKTVQCAK